jgi:spore germination protein KC
MKHESRVGILLSLLAVLMLVSGCWDKKELNEVAVVIGVGVDLDPDGKYQVTAQVIKPTTQGANSAGGGSELPTWSISSSGKTYTDAVSELNRISPRRLYWPHLQIVIFGQEMAKAGIAPVLTWFERDRDSRSGTFVVVTRGTAEDLLNQKIELGSVPAKSMADLINNAQIRQLPARQMTLRKLTAILVTPGIDTTLDIINPKKIRGKVETYELAGAAIFRGDKMVASVTNETVHGLAIASNKYENAILTVACPKNDKAYATYLLTDFQSKLRADWVDGRVLARLRVFIEGNVNDQTCQEQLLEPAAMDALELIIADKIRTLVSDMYEEGVKKHADVFGIGRKLRMTHPDVWRKVSKNWRSELRHVKLEIQTDANIRRGGLVIEPTIDKMKE